MSDAQTDAYFASRLAFDPKRDLLWKTLCEQVFQQYVPASGAVLELGAGWCDFINNIKASRRIALDIWAGVKDHIDPDVETHIGPATDLSFLNEDSIDVVFASNLLEHLSVDDDRALVAEAHRVLRPGGRLILVQPNYRLCAPRYFDDYTHVSVWSDVGLSDFLTAEGFELELVKPKFMPFTVKSRLPVVPALIKAYLRSPVKPQAGQMLLVATPASRS